MLGLFILALTLIVHPQKTFAEDGSEAVSNGQTLEKVIASAFVSKGFKEQSFKSWSKTGEQEGRFLLKNAPFRTLYGTSGKTEFLIQDAHRPGPIRLEAKWQQVSGSVDEKLPYLFLNAVHQMPEQHIIIVIDGPGWRQGAIDWLRHAADEQKKKQIDVFSLEQFLKWLNRAY